MQKKILKYNILCCILIFFLGGSLGGCAYIKKSSELSQEKKEKLEVQKRNFMALSAALDAHTIKIGVKDSEIRKTFGEPVRVFDSASNVSRFEIWTYEKEDPLQKDLDWVPIRLYFDNNKLVTWRY